MSVENLIEELGKSFKDNDCNTAYSTSGLLKKKNELINLKYTSHFIICMFQLKY